MPKGKISKAQERKLERLEVERLINARAQLVKDANNAEDLLENLPSFSVSNISSKMSQLSRDPLTLEFFCTL